MDHGEIAGKDDESNGEGTVENENPDHAGHERACRIGLVEPNAIIIRSSQRT